MLVVDNGKKKEMSKKPLNRHQKEKENPQGIGSPKAFEKRNDI